MVQSPRTDVVDVAPAQFSPGSALMLRSHGVPHADPHRTPRRLLPTRFARAGGSTRAWSLGARILSGNPGSLGLAPPRSSPQTRFRSVGALDPFPSPSSRLPFYARGFGFVHGGDHETHEVQLRRRGSRPGGRARTDVPRVCSGD